MVSSAVANISKHRKSEKQQKEATPPILSMENNSEKKMYYFLWMLLVIQCMYTSAELHVFEPFNILGLQPGASDSELKKAYRKMSVQHHPDKNPNPEATQYFVEFISKAYQALTDPISRENYEKYGHPDGRQGFQMGIALRQ